MAQEYNEIAKEYDLQPLAVSMEELCDILDENLPHQDLYKLEGADQLPARVALAGFISAMIVVEDIKSMLVIVDTAGGEDDSGETTH